MRRPTLSRRRRRRNRVARGAEHVLVRVLSALWLARLFARHGLRYVR
jgi:hypothetical protein